MNKKVIGIGKTMKNLGTKGVLCLLLFFSVLSTSAQQNIQLTQYIFNSLSVNPAYAGYKEDWFAQMALRNQWMGIDDAPQTGQVSIDGILDRYDKKMGIGLQIAADRLGPQSTTSAYLNYAYRLPLNNKGTSRLSFGIAAGVSQYAIDYNKLTPIDGGDEVVTKDETTSFVPDFRFGVYYHSPKWYVGASILDLLSSGLKDAASKDVIINKRHLYLMSGVILDINSDVKLRPSLLVKEDFRGPTSLDLNSMVIFRDKFWVGASYRTAVKLWGKEFEQGQRVSRTNSVAGLAQFFVTDAFRIGYSYDHTISSLGGIENGSHEITLGITLSNKFSGILNPRFF